MHGWKLTSGKLSVPHVAKTENCLCWPPETRHFNEINGWNSLKWHCCILKWQQIS